MSTTQSFLAKALYDNLAESPDELAFRRGDIITVLEVDTDGLEGWYLCSLRNKQGIAPGNRLKLITGMHGGNGDDSTLTREDRVKSLGSSPMKLVLPDNIPVYTHNSTPQVLDYDVPSTRTFHMDPHAFHTVPRSATKLSPQPSKIEHDQFSRTMNPKEMGSKYYSPLVKPRDQIDYDTPRHMQKQTNIFNSPVIKNNQVDYDTPLSNRQTSDGVLIQDQIDYDTPSARNYHVNSSGRKDDGSLDYDTPSSRSIVRNLYDIKQCSSTPDRSSYLSMNSTSTRSSNYSIQSDQQSGQMTSGIDSSRSSFDITAHDYYDVPPVHGAVSRDSGVDQDYDQPKHANCDDDYDVPRLNDSAYESPQVTKQARTINYMSHSSSMRFNLSSPRNKLDSLDYDSPHSHYTLSTNNDAPTSEPRVSVDDEYDVPHTPKSYNSDIGDHDTLKARKHGSVYDVPPQVTRDSVLSFRSDSSDGLDDSRFSTSSIDSFDLSCFTYPDLPLTLDSAIDLIVKLQQDAKKATLNVLSRVSSNWRKREVMESRMYDVKQSCVNIVTTLKAFVEFAQGALANSTHISDKKLSKKLYSQLLSLQEAYEKINNSVTELDSVNWNLMYLIEQKDPRKTDDLGVIVEVTKGVMNDVRRIASTIQGNSALLFRKSSATDNKHIEDSPTIIIQFGNKMSRLSPQVMQHRPLPNLPNEILTKDEDTLKKSQKKVSAKDELSEIIDEYDYVHLSSRKNIADAKKDDNLLNYDEITTLCDSLKESCGVTTKLTENRSIKLERNDQQVLVFYNRQLEQQNNELTAAVDAFFKCIEQNVAPREFVAFSKLVILAAHKLVYTGDTLHRNLMHREVRETVMNHANQLCNFVKDSVSSTKTAALQYPSVHLMQDMVDHVSKVSHSAKALRAYIKQTVLSASPLI